MEQLPSITIRLAQPDDIPLLGDVEDSAATLFTTIPAIAHHVFDPPMSSERLAQLIAAKHVWVALADRSAINSTTVVGFLAGYVFDDSSSFYLAELAVSSPHQRMGVGSLLINKMCSALRSEGLNSVVLVTYRDVPWNGPWYSKHGFMEINESECDMDLRVIMEEERESGNFDGATRCAMKRDLES